MDSEEYDSIQLLSVNELAEMYYQLLRQEMEMAAKDAKTNKKSFLGSLSDDAANRLTEFAERNEISHFSQTLTELITFLEWEVEKKTPEIPESTIYNSLLRVEKAAHQTSSWELYSGRDDDAGPLIAVTVFEMNMMEQTLSMYLTDLLVKNTSQKLFFPLTDVYNSDIIVKWRILEKIASIKVTPQRTIYKHKLTEYMRKRVQDEVTEWLDKELLSKLKMSGKSTVLKDAEILLKILKEFESHLNSAFDVLTMESSLFKETSCSYFDCLAKVLDEKIHPLCLQLMKSMDTYQEYHRSFHVNLRDSCALSHSLYVQIKKLVHILRSRRKTPQIWKLEDYSSLFVKFFMNLLQVMKSECHNRIKRAVDVESKDSVHSEEKILSSSVIVLNCICTVIDEWKHMEIEDQDMQTAFIIKIADIICDGAKIFSEALEHRLILEPEPPGDINFAKKVMTNVGLLPKIKNACILSNSIEHVRRYLEDLPRQMQWTESLDKLDEEAPDSTLCDQVLRILNLIHQSMDAHLQTIIAKILNSAAACLLSHCEKPLSTWIQSVNANQAYERFVCHFNEYLETIEESLKEELFPKFLTQLWSTLLMYIQTEIQEGLPPEYAKTLKENILNLMEYLTEIKMVEVETHRCILQQIMAILELNSKTTVELQLDYYSHVAESVISPVEYLGHIAFQAGYKIMGEATIDIYINVQKGQRLPARKFEMNELYVKLELCPNSLFPNQVPLKSTSVTEDLDNPVFNQFFQFSNLPSKVLSVKGAVIQVLVLNQDKSFSAEAVLMVNQVQNMSGFASLEFLPVYLMPLRKFDMSQISYRVLENRSRWDKTARNFINSRNKLSKNQTTLLSCISSKNTCVF